MKTSATTAPRGPGIRWNLRRNASLYLMVAPAVVLVFTFNYFPMYGLALGFQDFNPIKGFFGSEFVGLKWFRMLLRMPDVKQIVFNTLYIAVAKIVLQQIVSVLFALLLNEVAGKLFARVIQTLVYLPHFLSWVIVGGIFIDILSSHGLVNTFLGFFGIRSIFFLGSNDWFRNTMVATDIWKGFGWGSILYLAALAAINPDLYEAAAMDGAGRVRQTIHVTLPGIMPTIVLLGTLSLGGVLDAGFEQVLIMYNPAVYRTGDIIDTFVYRMGILGGNFSLATAVGLFKSIIGMILIVLSFRLARRYANYRIF